MKALPLAWYGRFDRARAELDAVSWEDCPPLIEATRYFALALIHLLEHDERSALQHARRAQRLGEVHSRLPGAGTSARAYAGMVTVCEGLADGRPDAVAVLEAEVSAGGMPSTYNMLLHWALARLHHLAGDDERAQFHADAYRAHAPHCVAPFERDATYRGRLDHPRS